MLSQQFLVYVSIYYVSAIRSFVYSSFVLIRSSLSRIFFLFSFNGKSKKERKKREKRRIVSVIKVKFLLQQVKDGSDERNVFEAFEVVIERRSLFY